MHDSHSTGEPSFLRGTRREKKQMAITAEWLTTGSVVAPLLFNVYTNDQPIHLGTRSFVYADDLAVTTQSTNFEHLMMMISIFNVEQYLFKGMLYCESVINMYSLGVKLTLFRRFVHLCYNVYSTTLVEFRTI